MSPREPGLAGLGLARELGGRGGSVADLAAAVIEIAAASPDAAQALVAHRLVVELLAGARNVALRDWLLPQLLAGERAGAWPASAMRALAEGRSEGLVAEDTGRGFRLSGALHDTVNATAEAMLLPCPAAFGAGAAPALVLLSGEQDGLRIEPAASGTVAVCVARVFFREDELLGGDAVALARRVHPLARALACASTQGLAEACVALLPDAGARGRVTHARRALLDALSVASTWQSPVLLEHWQGRSLALAQQALAAGAGDPRAADLHAALARRRAASETHAAAA